MFYELLLTMGIVVLTVSILNKMQLPPILGYLLTGVLIAPSGLGILHDMGDLDSLAHFGIVFMLFTIGLELSLQKLISMRRALINIGGMQVLLSSGLVIAIASMLNLHIGGAIAMAGAFAFSSTAVVTKLLVERGEMQTLHGRLVLSILLFQDLAAVPFLILIPALASNKGNIGHELFAIMLIGIFTFIAMLAAGRWIMRPLFHQVATAKSSELFMITAILVVLSSAWVTKSLNLSMELGAFLAGVMLAETEYSHQIENDIKPFRDILLGLFFIGVGVKLEPSFLIAEWHYILAIVTAIVTCKAAIITLLCRFIGRAPSKISLKTGLALAQSGEFGFVLLSLALSNHVINDFLNQLIVASTIISIALTPILIRYSHNIVEFITREQEQAASELSIMQNSTYEELTNHVIICGFGHVGQTLAKFLEQEGIPFVGLDLDPQKISEANAAGEPAFYGDATDQSVLLNANIKKAKQLVVTFDDHIKTRKVLQAVRKLNNKLLTLVSTRDDSYLTALQQAGATEVIPEKLEVSLMLASHMLMFLGHAPQKVQQQIQDVRNYRYNALRAYFRGSESYTENDNMEDNILHAIKITPNAYAIGKSTKTLYDDHDMQLTITSFYRNGFKCNDAPTVQTELQQGDVLVVKGTKQDVYNAEEFLIQGPAKTA